jgi:hypothetical protein
MSDIPFLLRNIEDPPVQNGMPYQRIFDKNQVNILEKEINNLLSIGVIKQVAFDEHQYISPIF